MTVNDIETIVSLTHFPVTVSGPKGSKTISEEEFRKMMTSMNGEEFKNVELKNAHVDMPSETMAIVYYSTKIKGQDMLDVSTWIRENEKWACVFHSKNPQTLQ